MAEIDCSPNIVGILADAAASTGIDQPLLGFPSLQLALRNQGDMPTSSSLLPRIAILSEEKCHSASGARENVFPSTRHRAISSPDNMLALASAQVILSHKF